MTEDKTKMEEVAPPMEIATEPPAEKLAAWKAQHGDVYESTFKGGVKFWFRTLKRAEFKGIMYDISKGPEDKEEAVCKLCTLWPENVNFSQFTGVQEGIPLIYSEYLMELSGFGPALDLKKV